MQWMYDAYKAAYKKSGKYPDDKEDDQIVSAVMDRIAEAEIWIPSGEVKKHFRSIKRNLHKRLAKELRQDLLDKLDRLFINGLEHAGGYDGSFIDRM